MEHAVKQLVEGLRYKPEGSKFDPQWCHWNLAALLYKAVYSPGLGRECIWDVTQDGNEVRYSVKSQRWRFLTLVTTQKLTS